MKHCTFMFFFTFTIGFMSVAQEGVPVYFDYQSDNYFLLHPSMAGIGEGTKIRATVRQQWFNVNEAPNLQTLNAHSRLGKNTGFGVIVFNDANGYHSQTGLKLGYAHHLRFGSDFRVLHQLSFGIGVGGQQSSLDESEFVSIEPDRTISGTKNSKSYFNTDIGISYNYLELYAHATVLNVLGRGRDLYAATESNDLRRYVGSVGYVFGKSEWQIEPSILFQLTEFNQEKTIDINTKIYKEMNFGTLWGGISYRRSFEGTEIQTADTMGEQRLQLITPLIGANYKKIMVSYNYSYQMGDMRIDDGGFHQLTLGYNFGQEKKRYDCNCPAVNY
ncbi:PorP/SprF family type IX secretion system membrane protein [Arenibacter nanhaiticus]|nr:type IX secretion system membrane protein PorP/SprF [Arenibacter nanhaiticus]